MALRLLEKFDRGNITVKVYRDTEWEEYSVRLYKNGIEQINASYHCEYLDDAMSTASIMIDEDHEGEMK